VAGEQRVVVRAQHREVLGDAAAGEILACSGIGLAYYVDDRKVGEVWVPAGDRPGVADERLIEALHQAVCWNETARSATPDLAGDDLAGNLMRDTELRIVTSPGTVAT
jgi:hypothetical protein